MTGMGERHRFCSFRIAHGWFILPAADVLEVICDLPMTRVPLAVSIRGLMNLRGQVVPVIDLRRRLEMAAGHQGESPVGIVVRAQEGPIILLVDEVEDVLELDDALCECPPATSRSSSGLIAGVYKLAGRLLHRLSLDAATAIEERGPSEMPGAVPVQGRHLEFEDTL